MFLFHLESKQKRNTATVFAYISCDSEAGTFSKTSFGLTGKRVTYQVRNTYGLFLNKMQILSEIPIMKTKMMFKRNRILQNVFHVCYSLDHFAT